MTVNLRVASVSSEYVDTLQLNSPDMSRVMLCSLNTRRLEVLVIISMLELMESSTI